MLVRNTANIEVYRLVRSQSTSGLIFTLKKNFLMDIEGWQNNNIAIGFN